MPALEEDFLISLLLKRFLLTLSLWGTVPSYPEKRLVSCDFNVRKINRNLIAWGEETDLEASVCVKTAHFICNLFELRLTRIKLKGLIWQDRLQCRLRKPSVILSIFLSRAAAVKLLLTLQLSLTPHWACQQMFQSHLQITVETAFFNAVSHNSEGSGKNAIKLYQLS